MAASRIPGPLTFMGNWKYGAPGPLRRRATSGVNKQGRLGDRPGPVGHGVGAAFGAKGTGADVDAQTFEGCYDYFLSVRADIDEICVEAQRVHNRLPAPYAGRLNILIELAVEARNDLERDIEDLRENGRTRLNLLDTELRLRQAEETGRRLVRVVEAWNAIDRANLFESLARLRRSELERARRLMQSLDELRDELAALKRIVSGEQLAEVFAQFGIGVAISGAAGVVATVSAPVAIGVTIIAALANLGLDALLGPSGVGAVDAGSAIAASPEDIIQSAERSNRAALEGAEALTRHDSVLGFAARRLPDNAAGIRGLFRGAAAVGTVAAAVDDYQELDEAIEAYEAACADIRTIRRKMREASRELRELAPLLRYPVLVEEILSGLEREARVLRENAQLVLHDEIVD